DETDVLVRRGDPLRVAPARRDDEQVQIGDAFDRFHAHSFEGDAGYLADHRRLRHVLHVDDQGRLVANVRADVEAIADRGDAAVLSPRQVVLRIEQRVVRDKLEVLQLTARRDVLDGR